MTLFGLSSWLPTLLTGLGLSAAQIVAISAASQAGGFLGSLTTARIIVRYPPLVVAAIGYIPAGLLLALFGTMGANMVGLLITGFLAYFCLIGTQNVVNAMAGQIYPPRVRATGVGWAIGIGRIGGTVGPMLIGLLIAGRRLVGRIIRSCGRCRSSSRLSPPLRCRVRLAISVHATRPRKNPSPNGAAMPGRAGASERAGNPRQSGGPSRSNSASIPAPISSAMALT